jgi:hypothetical protein
MINRYDDISVLWKYDWVVAFPWQDVQTYHARNPTGVAMTYVRLDRPAYDATMMNADSLGNRSRYIWSCSNINVAHQTVSNSYFPGMAERSSFEGWNGGTDQATDGLANNVGFIRAWNPATDSLHNADGSFRLEPGCPPWTVNHVWNLRTAGQLVGQLMTYGAKLAQVYGKGWDGVWTDNAFSREDRAWTDGLHAAFKYTRDSLPGKSVGGNGAWIEWYRNGWSGSDSNGYLKMSNANLVEGFVPHYGSINQTNVDSFINYNTKNLNYPDPYGLPRYNALWDWGGESTQQHVRWGLTLAIMASMYYQAPIPNPYTNPDPWYDEYWGGSLNQRGYLGQPIGPAVKLASGVYRRDFQNGIALNNSTGSAQTVSLGATFRHLTGTQAPAVNDGSSVTSVTISNGDGRILLR